jgi:hypothetical protein
MRSTEFSPRRRLILHAALFWMASIVLGGMVLDGGVLLKLYCMASLFLWPVLLIISRRRVPLSAAASTVFRASPLFLFILCFVMTSAFVAIGGE